MKKYIIIGVLICAIALGAGIWIYQKQEKVVTSTQDQLMIEAKDQLDRDNFDAAISTALQSVSANQSDANPLIFLAAAYAQKGSVEFKEQEYGQKALDTIELALKISPNNSEAYRVRGYAYEIMSSWPQATEAYNRAIILGPNNAHAYANRGHMYDLLGDFKKARADYSTAIELDPNEEHAVFNLARLEARADNLEEAKKLILQVVEKSSSAGRKAEMYQVLATIELAQGNFDVATTNINQSIALNDKLPAAYVTRGEINRARLAQQVFNKDVIPDFQDRVDTIVADASKATSIYEGQTTAIVLVGRLLVLLGEYDQSIKLFETALKMIDDDITLGITEKTSIRAAVTGYIKIVNENAK